MNLFCRPITLGDFASKAAIFVLLLGPVGCHIVGNTRPRTYTVALRALPDRLNPWENPVNVFNLILNHTYFPLLVRDQKTGELDSHFLDLASTMALSPKLDEYQFCLKPEAKFSDNQAIEVEDLKMALDHSKESEVLAQKGTLSSVKGKCVIHKLKHSDAQYLDRFGGVSNTILKRSTVGTVIPLGLGAYNVIEFSPKKIVLEHKQGEAPYFNRVEINRVQSVDEAVKLGLMDLNHLYLGELPKQFIQSMKKLSRQSHKSYAITVNFPDQEKRIQFARCFSLAEFTSLVGIPLSRIPGFLPLGTLASDVSFKEEVKPRQETATCKFGSRKPTLFYYNYNPNLTVLLTQFFSKHQEDLPFSIVVKTISVEDFIKRVYANEPMVRVSGFDSSGTAAAAYGEAATYFEPFLTSSPIRTVLTPIKNLDEEVRLAVDSQDSETKVRHYRAAHQVLLKSGYVIPLGQFVSDYYYPTWVSHIEWVDATSDFPRIDLMKAE